MVSVIVPVYNTEPFLEECIQSIVNQTYKELEIILINDGSTDGSGRICRKWERLDKRIKYIEKKNEGQGIARNIGIQMACGEYILFVDSDDYIDRHLINKVYHYISQQNADICVYAHHNVADDIYRENLDFKIIKGCSVKENKEILARLRPFVWEKMFSTSLLQKKNIVMSNHICEDLVFNAQLYIEAKKICILNSPLYYYRYKRDGNLSTNYHRCLEIEQSMDELNAIFKNNNYFEQYWVQLYSISFDRLKDALFRMKRRTDLEIPSDIKEQYPIFFDVYKNYFKKWFSSYINTALQEKNYLLIGSYNLRVIIHALLLDEDYLRKDYSYHSIISLMSEPFKLIRFASSLEDCTFKNDYRKRCVQQDVDKCFYQNADFQGIDYIVMDLLDEISDLIEIDSDTYLTESEFLQELQIPELQDYRRISLLSPERRKLFISFVRKFAEKVNAWHMPVILIKNFLCEKHSIYYDVFTEYEQLELIKKLNKELEWCYQMLYSSLHHVIVVDASAFKELVFTHEDFPFGCKPVYYNTSYYQRMAIQIGRCVRDRGN